MQQLALAVVLSLAVTSPLHGKQGGPDSGREHPVRTRVVADHPLVRASLDRLWQGSASWRAALREARGEVRILTPAQVVVQDGDRQRPFEADLLGAVTPVVGADGRVRQVLVVVNVPLLEATYARRLSTLSELHADLDRVLAHEVFGHALPYLLTGNLSGHCPDPGVGQRAEDACAIHRENLIRAELGLGRRTDAGLRGLALARGSRF